MRILAVALLGAGLAACGHHHGDPCNQPKHGHMSLVRVDDSTDHPRPQDPTNYMFRASAHQQAALDGPAANVRVDIDSWTGTGPLRSVEWYFSSPDRSAIERYVASLEPALVVPYDHRIAYQHTDRGWRTHYVRIAPILDDRALATGEVVHGAARFELTPAAAKLFGDASAEAVGHKVAFVVDGEVVSAPIVNAPIRGGTIEVTTANPAEAVQLVKQLGCAK